jgi:hypothetical protein
VGGDPDAFIDAQVEAFANDYATLMLPASAARAGSPRIVILRRAERPSMPFHGRRLARRSAGRAARPVGM